MSIVHFNTSWAYADSRIGSLGTKPQLRYTNDTGKKVKLTSVTYPTGVAGNGVTYTAGNTVTGTGKSINWYLTAGGKTSNSRSISNTVGRQLNPSGKWTIAYGELVNCTFTFSDPPIVNVGATLDIYMPFSSSNLYTVILRNRSIISCTTSVVEDTFTVTFKDYDGRVLKTQSGVAKGSSATPPANPSRTGYTFSGWIGNYTNVTANTTVTAKYTPNKYTVSYNANGGSNAPAAQTKTYGQDLKLQSSYPSKSVLMYFDGNGGTFGTRQISIPLTFKGWNTKSDGTGTSYSPRGTYSANASITLYAQWGPGTAGSNMPTSPSTGKSYVVSFNPVGGSVNPNSKTVECTFAGWYTLALGGTRIYSNTSISSNITVYAHWTDPSVGSMPTPVRARCSFVGWYNDSSYSKKISESNIISFNTTLYAKWKYQITLDGNGGTIFDGSSTSSSISIWKDNNVDITIPNYLVTYKSSDYQTEGLEFKCYNTQADGGGTSYNVGATYNGNAPLTLYAQYSAKTYTVRFLDGYSGAVLKSLTVTHGTTLSASQFPANPTRKGYSFVGWSGSWTNITSDRDIVAMWNYSPIWIRTVSGWQHYEPKEN